MSLVAAHDVAFSYGTEPVLDGVTFTIEPGEFAALVGPNGSGKSTLLRLVLGLLTPHRGTIELFGLSPEKFSLRGRLGYVAQRAALAKDFPATVEEVVTAGRLAARGWRARIRDDDRDEIEHALAAVSLLDLRDRRIGELSGGQQQRAFIAKAFASQPELLILDEPVAGVDPQSQRQFADSLVHLQKSHGAAVLLVSHELSAVADSLDRILVLKRRIVFDGSPDALTGNGVSLGIHDHDLPLWLEGLR